MPSADAYMIRRLSDGFFAKGSLAGDFDPVGRAWRSLAYMRSHLRNVVYSEPCEVLLLQLIPKTQATNFAESSLAHMERREKTKLVGYMVQNNQGLWSSGRRRFTRKGRLWMSLESTKKAHSSATATDTIIQYELKPVGAIPLAEIRYDLAPVIHYTPFASRGRLPVKKKRAACGLVVFDASPENTTTVPETTTCPNCLKTIVLRDAKKA